MTDRLELPRDFDFSLDPHRSALWETLAKLNRGLAGLEGRVDAVQAKAGDAQPDVRVSRYVAYPFAQTEEDPAEADVTDAVIPGHCGGRLTGSSTEPVPTSDISSTGTIYLLPYLDDRISLYDGADWAYYSLGSSGISLALTATSGWNYDVFAYLSGGSPALETLIWDGDTTRATALARQDGALVKSGDATRLYVGTIRASGTDVTKDVAGGRFVWNYHNRLIRTSSTAYTGSSNTESSTSWNSASAGASEFKHEYVIGVNEDPVYAEASTSYENPNSAGAGATYEFSVGLDTTTARSTSSHTHTHLIPSDSAHQSQDFTGKATYMALVGVGYHYLQAVERALSGSVTTTPSNDGENGLRSWSRM